MAESVASEIYTGEDDSPHNRQQDNPSPKLESAQYLCHKGSNQLANPINHALGIAESFL